MVKKSSKRHSSRKASQKEIYCLKCKERTPTKNEKLVYIQTERGEKCQNKGVCAVCKTEKRRFTKCPKH